MAIYHLSATVVQRSKGHSAVAGAAYRAGERLYDARLNEVQDYSRKRGIVQSEILAPEHAPAWVYDRGELWNRAEFAELRGNSQPAREIRLGLPYELTDAQRADLVRNFARDMFVGSGMVADISIHRPDRHGDQRNHHAHIMLTMRELDGDGFAARKNRDWNRSELLEHWREQWEAYQNRALEDAGSDARVDHRSLVAQGTGREPTRHLGKDASAIEREGKASRIGNENREVARHNQVIDSLVNEIAAIDAEIQRELELESRFSFPTAQELQPEPPATAAPFLFWEEQKERAQSAFNSPINRSFERDIKEQGEVTERGVGRNWYDRTIVLFENYYATSIQSIKLYWQRYVTNRGITKEDGKRDDRDRGGDDLGR
jgi:ATP-dependent exoDNAse (exonuclease V) alpha subunit